MLTILNASFLGLPAMNVAIATPPCGMKFLKPKEQKVITVLQANNKTCYPECNETFKVAYREMLKNEGRGCRTICRNKNKIIR